MTAEQDLIFAVHVIEHVSDPDAFARACHRLLREDGSLVLVTPAADSANLRFFKAAWWMLEDPTHVQFFSRRSITILLEAAGFADVAVRRLVVDSLASDAASAVRALRWPHLPRRGVLDDRVTRAIVVLSAPLVLLARALFRTARPVLEVTARRAGPEP